MKNQLRELRARTARLDIRAPVGGYILERRSDLSVDVRNPEHELNVEIRDMAYLYAKVYQAPGGKERLFEHVPLTYYKDQYSVHIRPCSFEDLVEIDTFNELRTLDASYGV